jgi:LysR family transcriptional regulator for metE and metH
LRLLVGNREATLSALAGMHIDIAITGYPPETLPVDKEAIGDHPHIIIAPSDHRFAVRRRLALADLASETFLVREPGSGTRLLMQRRFEQAGLRPRIAMEVDSNETIKQAVMAGLGIAFISAHTVAVEIRERRLAVLNVAGLPIMRTWYAVKHTEKRLLPAGLAMWDFLVSDASRFLPDVKQMLAKPVRSNARK